MLYRSVDLNLHCQENAKDALFTLGFQSFLQNVNLTIIGCIALREKICNKIQQKATFTQELLGGDCEEKRDERLQCERERDHACPLVQNEQGIED